MHSAAATIWLVYMYRLTVHGVMCPVCGFVVYNHRHLAD